MSEILPPPGEAPTETPGQAHAPAVEPVAQSAPAATAAPESTAAPAPALAELSPAACAAALAQRFPALFGQGAQPLKLRIQADIQQRAPGVFSKKALSGFLHRYTTTTTYLQALTRAAQRLDLDGAPAGEIDPEHRQAAADELARRRSVHEARRAAERAERRAADQAAQRAEQAARQAVEAQARHAQAAQDNARRERAALLRAFDSSTLTRANFCALKGLPEAELEALLATARQEAAAERQQGTGPEQRGAGLHAGPRPGPQPHRAGPRQGRPGKPESR